MIETVKTCDICGSDLEYVGCWNCGGDGGFHDCGADCCPCLYPELDLNEECEICQGEGGFLECPDAENHARIWRVMQ